ncbi:hypothetical protein K431DRAFT_297034 [Polychaeton citri CBS 116435]|uniref:Uncharacterized protein n=1 Tax=Polychaeton citri CBS 116435 TaxID=1314669 RepID=A0A9P4Q2E3_9PEZI|nr:hypothetical protein K431DRAFT_297034 [Polychaeton citri CBS 116435]
MVITQAALKALWLSLSIWLQDLPDPTNHSNQLELWKASYGEYYAAGLYESTKSQNVAISRMTLKANVTQSILFTSLGLVNVPLCLEVAFNTSLVKVIEACSTLAIPHLLTEPTLHTYLSYLKNKVQAALRVAANLTDNAANIAKAFTLTGDNLSGDYLAVLGTTLQDGVRVSLLYGDRDYAWNSFDRQNANITNPRLGGEALSLAVPRNHSSLFRGSGYESADFPIEASDGTRTPRAYVKQHSNLSFVRVLDSSHAINTWLSVGFNVYNCSIQGIVSGATKLN